MSTKPRNKASMDAERVARMMAAQEEQEPAQEELQEPLVEASHVEPPPVEPSPLAVPAPLVPVAVVQAEAAATVSEASPQNEMPEFDPGKVDGRTLRKTGREPFATRIKPEAHEALRRIAYTRQITMAEALELAVAAFEKRLKPEGRKPTA